MHQPSTIARAVLAACAVAVASIASAASPPDSILSGNIKEADGTTGQDTNTGSGIKTGHIQDGAVTPAKLGGLIPASKIDRTGLDADSLDGYQAGDFSPIMHNHIPSEIQGFDAYLDQRYQHRTATVIVVAPDAPDGVPGMFRDPVAAVASITDASSSNRYLVKVMPGEYSFLELTMKPFVDLAGAGENLTRFVVGWALWLSHDSEVRDVTISNAGVSYNNLSEIPLGEARLTRATVVVTTCSPNVIATGLDNGAVLDHVHISVNPSCAAYATAMIVRGRVVVRDSDIAVNAQSADGIYLYQVYGSTVAPDLLLESSRVSVAGTSQTYGGIYATAGNVSLRNSSVTADIAPTGSGGAAVSVFGGVVQAEGSVLIGRGSATAASVWDGTGRFAQSRIEGAVSVSGSGIVRCIGVYDADYAPVTCP